MSDNGKNREESQMSNQLKEITPHMFMKADIMMILATAKGPVLVKRLRQAIDIIKKQYPPNVHVKTHPKVLYRILVQLEREGWIESTTTHTIPAAKTLAFTASGKNLITLWKKMLAIGEKTA
jgi:DNA-binding PadR family transcriptional regulator